MECRTSREATSGRPHPIRIHADWSVETPHDLAAERIAAAFGGYTSCLELVERVVPAVARAMPLLARRAPLPLRRAEDDRTWVVPPLRGCRCSHPTFGSARSAGIHLRSTPHLSRQLGVAAEPLEVLLDAVRGASDLLDVRRLPAYDAATRALVLEDSGVDELWDAGIHPAEIAALAAPARVVAGGLPVAYFLAVRYGSADLGWVERTVARRPDPAVATWLAWTPAGHHLVREEVGDWLALGLSRRQVEAVVAEGVPPGAAAGLASASGRSEHAAAVDLSGWAAAGCHPTVAHVLLLDRHGVGRDHRPARAAVDNLTTIAARHPDPPDRTELGVLLALAGTTVAVERALRAGVRTAAGWAAPGAAPPATAPPAPPAPPATPAPPPVPTTRGAHPW